MNHSFDIDIAKEYGILEAVFLNNLYFWIRRNEANDENFRDGRYWTYNTSKALAELFPYASKKQIERVIQHLRDEGIILTGNYNQQKFDRTLWYSITDKGKVLLNRKEIDFPNLGNAFPSEGTPIPYINTDINNTPLPKENSLTGVKEKVPLFPDASDELRAALQDFADMRKAMKAPLTQRACVLLRNNLEKLAPDEETQIAILNQSIVNNWKSVYPLHEEDRQAKNNKPSTDDILKDFFERKARGDFDD